MNRMVVVRAGPEREAFEAGALSYGLGESDSDLSLRANASPDFYAYIDGWYYAEQRDALDAALACVRPVYH